MCGIAKSVSLVRVYHQLRLYAFGAQRMPELEALRSRAFAVAITDHNEGRRLDFLDVFDRRALGVDVCIVIDGFAEEWHHPLDNGGCAVVALPVADACSCDCGPEAIGLRDAEHGHEAAVAPAGEAFTIFVDGKALFEDVHTGE